MADQLTHKWYINRPLLVELFVLFNLAFLTLDVFIAHSVNAFHHWAEWIPVYFAAISTVILLAGFYYYRFTFHKGWAGRLGLIVGWLSILVGITGIIGLQVLVGMVGFYFHLVVDLQGPAPSLKDDILYGAPIFAPLLLPNLAILAAIGVWDRREKSRRMLNSSNQVSPVTA